MGKISQEKIATRVKYPRKTAIGGNIPGENRNGGRKSVWKTGMAARYPRGKMGMAVRYPLGKRE